MRRTTLIDPRGRSWRVLVAQTRRERMRGSLGRPPGNAMLFERTRSVHTFGMREPILVALLDRGHRVRSVRIVPPRRVVFPRPRVRHVLEAAPEADLRAGDVLRPATARAASR